MKKFLVIGAVAVIVLAAAGIFLALTNLGSIIGKAVNTYGPEMTKTDVSLGDVGVSLFAGKATLKDLYLGNPPGFSAKEALVVPSISVAFDRASFMQETLVIETIELLRPSITYEKQQKSDNFKTIMENISRYGSGTNKGGGAKAGHGEGQRKLLIREFIIRDGKLRILVPGPSGRSLTAAMPDIHLTNIGADRSGAAPSEIFGQIFGVLYGKIISTSPGGVIGGVEAVGSPGNLRSD